MVHVQWWGALLGKANTDFQHLKVQEYPPIHQLLSTFSGHILLFRKYKIVMLLTPGRDVKWSLHYNISFPRMKGKWGQRKGSGKVPRIKMSLQQFVHKRLPPAPQWEWVGFKHQGIVSDNPVVHQLPSKLRVFFTKEQTLHIGCILRQKRALDLHQHQLFQFLRVLSTWATRKDGISSSFAVWLSH